MANKPVLADDTDDEDLGTVEEEEQLASYLAGSPAEPPAEEAEVSEKSDAVLSPAEQLQQYLDAGVPLSQLALTTARDGQLISVERATL